MAVIDQIITDEYALYHGDSCEVLPTLPDGSIDHVIYDGRIWTSGRRSESGWREYSPRISDNTSDEARAVLEHRDHVHVDVIEGD